MDVIQRVLDELKKWTRGSLMKSNKAKWREAGLKTLKKSLPIKLFYDSMKINK